MMAWVRLGRDPTPHVEDVLESASHPVTPMGLGDNRTGGESERFKTGEEIWWEVRNGGSRSALS